MLKKLDSLLLYVNDVANSAKFYRDLGFKIPKQTDTMVIAKLGGFEIHCHDRKTTVFQEESQIEQKGAGIYIYINVEKIDDYYKSLLEKGLKPSSEPKNWQWGNREFVIRDPDGYKLVFYEQISSL